MPGIIVTQFPSHCFDCGADLPVGSKARYYGRGRIYGIGCHERPAFVEGAETTADAPAHVVAVASSETISAPIPTAKASKAPKAPAPNPEPKPTAPKRDTLGTLTTRAADLLAAVKRVARGLGKRAGIPALTGILLEADGGTLTLTATDLETTIRETVETGPGKWRALVPGKILAETLKAHPSTLVRVETDQGTIGIGVGDGAGGPILSTIRLLPAEDFPKVGIPDGATVTIPADTFAETVKAVSVAASKDEARPVLTGTLVELTAGMGANVTATDSYRLHTATVEAEASADVRGIIPSRALLEAAKVAARYAESVTLTIGETSAAVQVGQWVAVTRLVDGEFPNYRQLMPAEDDGDALELGELLATIEAAKPYAKGSSPVRLELNGSVDLTASSPDLGEFRRSVPGAAWSGPEMVAAFHPGYLSDALKAAGGPLRIRSDGGGVSLKPATCGTGRVRALVMPVRVPAPIPAEVAA